MDMLPALLHGPRHVHCEAETKEQMLDRDAITMVNRFPVVTIACMETFPEIRIAVVA